MAGKEITSGELLLFISHTVYETLPQRLSKIDPRCTLPYTGQSATLGDPSVDFPNVFPDTVRFGNPHEEILGTCYPPQYFQYWGLGGAFDCITQSFRLLLKARANTGFKQPRYTFRSKSFLLDFNQPIHLKLSVEDSFRPALGVRGSYTSM